MNKTAHILIAVTIAAAMAACSKEEQAPVVEKTRLTISTEAVKAQMSDCQSTATRFEPGDKIKVNGEECTVLFDNENVPYVEVATAETYEAWYPANLCSASASGLNLCKLQTAQFAYYDGNSAITGIGRFNPLWAAPSRNDSPVLKFKPMCGILKLTVKGDSSVKIGSIRVENKAGDAISGDFVNRSEVLAAKETATVSQNYVVLNCGRGVALSQAGTSFYLCIPQGVYSSGFKITICDVTSHRSMIVDSNTSRTITAGEILSTPAITYSPASDLIWSEYFDVFVWGADYVGGRKTYNLNGTTDLSSNPGWDVPATAVCDPATTVSNDVNFNSQYSVKPEYVSNMEGFSSTQARIKNVYICPGYLACGNAGTRTVLDTETIPCTGKVKVCVDFARNLDDEKQDGINFQGKTGSISEVVVNGVSYTASDSSVGVTISGGKLTLDKTKFLTAGWQHLEISFTGVTSGFYFITFQSTSSGNVARYYIDNIQVWDMN